MADQAVSALSQRWREDAGATYQSWFLWPERPEEFQSEAGCGKS
jgi:uncharacterized protein YukE